MQSRPGSCTAAVVHRRYSVYSKKVKDHLVSRQDANDHGDSNNLTFTVQWHASIAEVSKTEWDALAAPLHTPFLEWEWLHQLEASGSIQPQQGWVPAHLTLWHDTRLVAAAPLYAKTHSMGEFVFDFAWADVADQLGQEYYPKLVGMSPATPSVGYRFLVAEQLDLASTTRAMLQVIHQFCEENSLHSVSFLFADPEWAEVVAGAGFCAWEHQSYLWQNDGFNTFEDYLAAFTKNQRRNIRRERASVAEQRLLLEAVPAESAPDSWFSLMYDYYENTNEQFGPWAAKYLERPFFEGLKQSYRSRLLFVAAFEREARGSQAGHSLRTGLSRQTGRSPVALSFLVHKNDHLVGRYWGARRYFENLHFNACYYMPIEWAITNGIRTFDPGAGSPHKVRRGFRAVINRSLHHFYNPVLRSLMERNIDRINRHERRQAEELNSLLPLKPRDANET